MITLFLVDKYSGLVLGVFAVLCGQRRINVKKQWLKEFMVYQPAFNEDVYAADFIVKYNHLSKISCKAAKCRVKTPSDLHLKIPFSSDRI